MFRRSNLHVTKDLAPLTRRRLEGVSVASSPGFKRTEGPEDNKEQPSHDRLSEGSRADVVRVHGQYGRTVGGVGAQAQSVRVKGLGFRV